MKSTSIYELETLYKISIPVHEEMDYYVGLLLQSEKFKKLPKAISDMEEAEKNNQYGTIKGLKNVHMDIMIDYIKNTQAFQKFTDFNLDSLTPFKGMDHRGNYFHNHNEEYVFLSIDMVNANYAIFRYLFDLDKGELCESWNELCDKLKVPAVFKYSKSFRQIVFGNLNPKRCQTIMQSVITKIYNIILDKTKPEDHFVYVTHDEIILKFGKNTLDHTHHTQMIIDILRDFQMPLKYTLFKIEHIGDKRKMFIKNTLNENGEFKNSEIIGVPGNQFFYYFKKYILHQPLDKRDLIFNQDKKLAMWLKTPEGEEIQESFIEEEVEKYNV